MAECDLAWILSLGPQKWYTKALQHGSQDPFKMNHTRATLMPYEPLTLITKSSTRMPHNNLILCSSFTWSNVCDGKCHIPQLIVFKGSTSLAVTESRKELEADSSPGESLMARGWLQKLSKGKSPTIWVCIVGGGGAGRKWLENSCSPVLQFNVISEEEIASPCSLGFSYTFASAWY